MSEKKEQKECNCQRKGFWIEYDKNGNPIYCHTARHSGENHVIRQPIQKLAEMLKPQTA